MLRYAVWWHTVVPPCIKSVQVKGIWPTIPADIPTWYLASPMQMVDILKYLLYNILSSTRMHQYLGAFALVISIWSAVRGQSVGDHRMWFIKKCSVCMSHFSFIICNCHLEYVQHVLVNKMSIQFLKSNRGRPDEQASYAICVRGRRPEQSSTRSCRNKWLQAYSAQEFVRIIRTPVYPSFAFVWLNSFRLFFPSRCALM